MGQPGTKQTEYYLNANTVSLSPPILTSDEMQDPKRLRLLLAERDEIIEGLAEDIRRITQELNKLVTGEKVLVSEPGVGESTV